MPLRLPPELVAKLDAEVERRADLKLTRSGMVRRLLEGAIWHMEANTEIGQRLKAALDLQIGAPPAENVGDRKDIQLTGNEESE